MGKASGDEADGARGKIRVFLLDDHEVVRRGLHDLLDAEADIEVIGDAGPRRRRMNGCWSCARCRPAGRAAARWGRRVGLPGHPVALPGTACLMLTGYGDDQALLGAIMAGAAGYAMKQASSADWSARSGRWRPAGPPSTPMPRSG